ncbi:hypothetical protein [Nocardioides sp.]|uniref:hypothetical protein n=1 Tax=Nocardioides sp. TaxID=35761 RepID=UPI00271B4236|nr:hypothetical protein [Nocardioides sp.]MDO9457613.1 hypothetical protein [Nocardioides sp.]
MPRLAKLTVLPVVAAVVLAALAAPPGGAAVSRDVEPRVPAAAADRGGPGSWTKVSTGTGSITFSSSLHRTPDGVLHVVYPRDEGTTGQIGHTAIRANGTTALANLVLPTSWSIVEPTPVVTAGPSGAGLRVVFGGQQTTSPGFWSDGKMYTLTAPASGTPWALPMETVGQSGAAYASYGTAATTLADGTPVAAYPLNSSVTWHVGTGTGPDQSFTHAACCVYDLAMVRSGSEVYVGYYANGGTPATQGTFVRRIHPTLGPLLKAPGSSVGDASVPTERVALAARAGGGVYAAYCAGYPTCTGIRLWKVGASRAIAVPGSRYAARIALAAAPGGRLWLSWGDNLPSVKAVRTNPAATRLGIRRDAGVPRGHPAIYALAMEGSTGRGDVVINVGDGFWHTQVLAGLTLQAAPARWRHGTAKQVKFTVTDAGDKVRGALVKVGSRRCTTSVQGTCRITFPRTVGAGRPTARATKAGYAPGTKRLRVT